MTITHELATNVMDPEHICRSPLRIGVVLGDAVAKWQARIVRELDLLDCAEVSAIIRCPQTASSSHKCAPLLRCWSRLDRTIFKNRSSYRDAFDIIPFEVPSSAKQMTIKPDGEKYSLSAEARRELNAKSLDLIVLLEGVPLSPELASASVFGEWTVLSEDVRDLALSSMLVHRSVMPGRIALHRNGRSSLYIDESFRAADAVSLFRNHSSGCWHAADAITAAVRELYYQGRPHIQSAVSQQHSMSQLSARNTVSFVASVAKEGIARQISKRFLRERWFIAYRKVRGQAIGDARNTFKVLWPPKDRFYADPFLVEWKGRTYIFFEDYSFPDAKAIISYVEIDAAGGCSSPKPALQEPFHLSYPYIFIDDGQIYMLPETKDDRSIRLYRAAAFPDKWKLDRVLLSDVTAVDSSLVRYGARYWLFTSGLQGTERGFDGDSQLYLFSADSLDGTWHPHPWNPVVRDVRSCRSAGTLVLRDGILFRPAQDCSSRYGRAVRFNRVDDLSPSSYHETAVAYIGPEWMSANRGTHTYNATSEYEVVDGRVLSRPLSRRFEKAVLSSYQPIQELSNAVGTNDQ